MTKGRQQSEKCLCFWNCRIQRTTVVFLPGAGPIPPPSNTQVDWREGSSRVGHAMRTGSKIMQLKGTHLILGGIKGHRAGRGIWSTWGYLCGRGRSTVFNGEIRGSFIEKAALEDGPRRGEEVSHADRHPEKSRLRPRAQQVQGPWGRSVAGMFLTQVNGQSQVSTRNSTEFWWWEPGHDLVGSFTTDTPTVALGCDF